MNQHPSIKEVLALRRALGIKKRPGRLPNNELPKLLINKYKKQLLVLVKLWKDATERILFPHLPDIEKRVMMERHVADGWPEDLQAQNDLLLDDYNRLSLQSSQIAAGTFSEVNGLSHKRWYAMAKKVMGVDLIKSEPWIDSEARAFVAENVTLVKKLAANTAHDISQIVMNGFRTGKRIETMKAEILGTDLTADIYPYFGKVENRAATIARDQTSKLWGNVNRMRQQGVGVKIYIWRTAMDERVVGNPEGKYPVGNAIHGNHWIMEGKYCLWSDPTVYANTLEEAMSGKWKKRTAEMPKAHPGEQISCRCYSSPVFETLYAEVK